MSKKIVPVLLLLIVWGTSINAGSHTPYKHSFGGNGYTSETRYTFPWLVRHFDAAMAGTNDFLKALLDTARVYGENFEAGPYASSQEINLYEKNGSSISYTERLTDTLDHWLYIYAKYYLENIVGVSVESLVVHLADTAVSITQQGDGIRSYSLTGLTHPQKRFTYQYWNNVSGDYFYPAGYVWLANGYNEDARNAIAYAYRRHLIEDSAKVGAGPINSHYTAYFMDNQYRDAGRLGSYYTINSTAGGPTSQMDWMEQTAIQTDSQMYYFDHSTLRIDSTIQAVLDSTCQAHGLARIRGYANINKFSPTHLSAVLPFVAGVSLENPIDYAKSPSNWRSWYAMADTMAHHPEVEVNWGIAGDILCSSSPSSWLYDSTRIYMMHYAFFLTVQDTNAYVGMMRFNDSLRWRNIYEVDFGQPDAPAYEVSHTGTSDWGDTPYIYVMRRNYNGGKAAVLVRTANGSADYVNDSISVALGDTYREVLANGDTSATLVTATYLKPYMGKIFLLNSALDVQTWPTPLYPINRTKVSITKPTLEVANVINQGQENIYYFQLSQDSTFATYISSGPVTEGSEGTTRWTIPSPLKDGKTYYWRSQVNLSPYSETESFVVEAKVFISPNPFRPSTGQQQVTIHNMTAGGTLIITTITNEVVKIITGDNSGEITWNVNGDNGKPLASDVYLCYYKDSKQSNHFKFAVIR